MLDVDRRMRGNSKRAPRCAVSTSFSRVRNAGRATLIGGACLLAGCATNHALMPTPALYTGPNAKPLFTDAPIDPRPPTLDLFFLTDRAPADGTGDLPYTAERSRSIAFGSTMIEFTKGETLTLGATTELGRFPAIPYPLMQVPDGMRRAPAVVEAHEAGETAFARRDSEAARHRTPQGNRAVRARLSRQLRGVPR